MARDRLDNLLAVPSCHYDPIFAARVRQAFASYAPTVVALECPPEIAGELAWAHDCWPVPVCSLFGGSGVPFVPGDSIFEAYRLARAANIPVHLIDAPFEAWRRATYAAEGGWPEPETAVRGGDEFLDAIAAMSDRAGPTPSDSKREAWMASALAALMQQNERVLWVGGAAHSARMRARLVAGARPRDLTTDAADVTFERARLAPSALLALCRRLPYLVAAYARAPDAYEEDVALRALALEAVPEVEGKTWVLRREGRDDGDDQELPETCSAADISKMLTYARNLAMCHKLGFRPELFELLNAASAVIGNRYAGRLYTLAMRELSSPKTEDLPSLERRPDGTPGGFSLEGRETELRPTPWWSGSRPGKPITVEEVERRGDAPYRSLEPGGPGDKLVWRCLPSDEQSYEAFVQYLLRRATVTDPFEARSAPFQTGMRDGVDIRATIRDVHEGRIFVREHQPLRQHVTNGLIDFANDSEWSPMLQGTGERGGWADPSFVHFGSASRNLRNDVLQRDPCKILRMHREVSLITLDGVNAGIEGDDRSFYDRVIMPLVRARDERRDLYSWLEIMFAFCPKKPFAYFSRYVPSVRVHRVAAAFGVRIVHQPLRRVPRALLERNRTFRFANLTLRQWDELTQRTAESRRPWRDASESPRS